MEKMSLFFDHSSTTPLDPQVLEAMMPYLKGEYGNPSSHIHSLGRSALKAVDGAREETAKLINAQPDEIIFTSGATEANNMAMKGLALPRREKGGHVLISQVEHFSVLNGAKRLRSYGFDVSQIPVDNYGVIKLDEMERLIRPDTFLVAVMGANTEIGTIQPIKEAVSLAKGINPGVHFHCDATSSAGWIPTDVKDTGVDSLTLSAHNFYGPKGVGALYLRQRASLEPLLDGGFQEGGRRAGTENVPGIAGLGRAAALARTHMPDRLSRLGMLQERLWGGLKEKLQFLHFTGHPRERLPGHVSFWIEYAEGESLLLMLQVKGIMAASGSACSSNMLAGDEDELIHSHVLAAIGVPQDICSGSITFFMGKDNTREEVDYVVQEMPGIIEKLWAMSPAYSDMLKEIGTGT
jgi:cysteine desulfurase